MYREYTSAAEMLARYREVSQRLYDPPTQPAPKLSAAEEEAERKREEGIRAVTAVWHRAQAARLTLEEKLEAIRVLESERAKLVRAAFEEYISSVSHRAHSDAVARAMIRSGFQREAESLLAEVSSATRVRMMICLVQEVTSIHEKDLCGPSRTSSFAKARHILFFLLRKFTDSSFPSIANRIGGRDHTTVMHGVRRIEEQLAKSDVPLQAPREIAEFLWATDWIGNGRRRTAA